MSYQQARSNPAILAAAAAAAVWISATHSHGAEVTITKGDGKAIVKIDGELFTEYVFEGHAKPILYPIIGPTGVGMTRNYPMIENVDNEAHDHPHQKSLWFTHDDVNGVQFWAEYAPKGTESKYGRMVQTEMKIEGACIRTKDNWVAPDGKIVCTDSRVLGFGVTPAGRYLDFGITIHASHGNVVFGDTKEGTMAMRTHPLLNLEADKRGTHTAKGNAMNSEGIEGKDIWASGPSGLTIGRPWKARPSALRCSITPRIPGTPPGGTRGPTDWSRPTRSASTTSRTSRNMRAT